MPETYIGAGEQGATPQEAALIFMTELVIHWPRTLNTNEERRPFLLARPRFEAAYIAKIRTPLPRDPDKEAPLVVKAPD